MREEILQKIKEDYEQKRKKREDLSKLLEEVTKLEEDEKVKRYLKLKEELESVDYKKRLSESDEQILDSTFWYHQYMIKDTNNIYLCLGTFMMESTCDIEHGPSDIRLKRDDPRAEYRIYRNIEHGYSKQIPIRKCEEFERTHTIIFPKMDILADKYFYEIQKEFITLAVTEGQEEACKRVLSKNK